MPEKKTTKSKSKSASSGSSKKSGSSKGGRHIKLTLKELIIIAVAAVVLFFAYQYSPTVRSVVDDVIAEILTQDEGKTEVSGGTEIGNVDLSDEYLLPVCPGGADHIHRDYTGYSLCYRESYEQAEWAATCLTREKLKKKASGRTDNFRPDPEVETGSSTLADYKGSGYDRGHLVPAADLAWSEKSMDDSFYMTNMSPQTADFNRGIWKELEEKVRDWAKEFGTVYTVSGPILEKKKYKTIGASKVAVPEYYYKVLLAHTDDDKWSAIGFILPNAGSDKPFIDFAVSVDEVERRCNIDFFAPLDDDVEAQLESKYDAKFWGLKK